MLKKEGVLEVKALLHCYCLRNDATNLCIYFAGACHAIFITPTGGWVTMCGILFTWFFRFVQGGVLQLKGGSRVFLFLQVGLVVTYSLNLEVLLAKMDCRSSSTPNFWLFHLNSWNKVGQIGGSSEFIGSFWKPEVDQSTEINPQYLPCDNP